MIIAPNFIACRFNWRGCLRKTNLQFRGIPFCERNIFISFTNFILFELKSSLPLFRIYIILLNGLFYSENSLLFQVKLSHEERHLRSTSHPGPTPPLQNNCPLQWKVHGREEFRLWLWQQDIQIGMWNEERQLRVSK